MSNEHADNKDKGVEIFVNGQSKTVQKNADLSYDQAVDLAYETEPRPTGDGLEFVITYRRGQGEKPEGSLQPGGSVKVKDGMIVNVTPTNKS